MVPLAIIDLDSDDETPTSPTSQNETVNLPTTTRENPIDLTFEDSESESLPNNDLPQMPITTNSAATTSSRVTNPRPGHAAPQPRSSLPGPPDTQEEEEEDSDGDFFDLLKRTHKPQAKRVKRSLSGPDTQMVIPPSPSPTKRRAPRVSKGSAGIEPPREDEDITSMKIPAHVRRLSKAVNNPEVKGNTTKKSGLREPTLTSASKKKENKAKDTVSHTRRVQNILKRIRDAPTEALIPLAPNVSRATASTTSDKPATARTPEEQQPRKERTQSSSSKEVTESSEADDPPPAVANFSTDVSRFFSPSTQIEVELDTEAGQEESMDYELDQAAGPYDPTAASRGAGSSRDTAKYNIYNIPQSGWRSQAALSAPSSASKNPTNQGSAAGSDCASPLTTTNSSNGKGVDKSTEQSNALTVNDLALSTAVETPKKTDNRKRKRKAVIDSDDDDAYSPRVGGKKLRAQRERDVSQDETELHAFLDGIQAVLAPKSQQVERSEDSSKDEVADEIVTAAQLDIDQAISSANGSGNAGEGMADETVQEHESHLNDVDIEMTPVNVDAAIPPADDRVDSEVDELDELDELEDDELDARPDIQLDTELILGPGNENYQVSPERPGFFDFIRDSQPSPAKGTGPGYLYTPSPASTHGPLPTEPNAQQNTKGLIGSPQPKSSDGIAEVEDILVNQFSPELADRSPKDLVQDLPMEGMQKGETENGYDDESDPGDQTMIAVHPEHTTHNGELSAVDKAAVEANLPSSNPKGSTLAKSPDVLNLPNSPNFIFSTANIVEPLDLARQKILAEYRGMLAGAPGFRNGHQRLSLTPLHAPWEILRPYFKHRLELENLKNSHSAQRQGSSVEL